MLQPARRKYRKEQKGRNTGIATRGNTVAFGDFGLKCTDRGRLTARQIEAPRPGPPAAPPDGGGARCVSPPRQAWWPYLDPCVPGQAYFQEARRSAYG